MNASEIEQEKAFILDTIRSTGMSRTAVIVGLARTRHIDPDVWEYIGQNLRDISAPTLDFIANLPFKTQRLIVASINARGIDVHAAILAVTGEVVSDDAGYVSALSDLWAAAPENVRELFTKKIRLSK